MYKDTTEVNKLIKDKKWTGYIWYISSKAPIIYTNETVPEINITAPNYIQEMYLSDGDKTAIHTKYLGDANQRFFVNKLSDFEPNNEFKIGDEITYPSHIKAEKGQIENKFKTIYKLTDNIDGISKSWEPLFEFFVGLTFKANLNAK